MVFNKRHLTIDAHVPNFILGTTLYWAATFMTLKWSGRPAQTYHFEGSNSSKKKKFNDCGLHEKIYRHQSSILAPLYIGHIADDYVRRFTAHSTCTHWWIYM